MRAAMLSAHREALIAATIAGLSTPFKEEDSA